MSVFIVGIVGSPRKGGLTTKLVTKALESLKYMSMTMLDEIMLLASQLFKTSPRRDNLKKARESYAKAAKLIEEGKRLEAIPHAVKAYQDLGEKAHAFLRVG